MQYKSRKMRGEVDVNKKQKNLCPFCFYKSEEWEDNWCCPHCGKPVNKDQDGKLPAICHNCKKSPQMWKINTETPICPRCKSIIPIKDLNECDEIFPIAVVGPTRSGKTHFLTVLAHELTVKGIWEKDYWSAVRVIRREVDNSHGIRAIKQTDEFLAFDGFLYGGREGTLQGTKKDFKTCSLLIKLIYKSGMSTCFKAPWKKNKILLAFSDTAGEGFKQDSWHDIAERYPVFQNHAKAIIAMVDPLELKKIRDEANALQTEYINCGILPPKEEAFPTVNTSDVVSIPQLKELKGYPIAWCMTKTVALVKLRKIEENIDTDLARNLGGLGGDDETSKTSGKVNIEKLKEVSELTKKFILTNNDGKGLPYYKYHCYFAVDALGNSFDKGSLNGETPKPLRILDPLLWILWQYGLCGGR